MNRIWKISLGILFLGTFTFLGGVFLQPYQSEYQKQEILGSVSELAAFVEPDDGLAPVINRVRAADKQILVEVYILSDPEIISELIAADRRGVDVKVILEERPFGGNRLNQKSRVTLTNGGVEVKWSRKLFRFTHEKAIMFDGHEACILNANLSASAFVNNREFSICTLNKGEVKELQEIFWGDWGNSEVTVVQKNLVVSPVNSRAKLLSLLRQAENHIEIVMEVLDDEETVGILQEKSQKISVRVLMPTPEQILANKDGAEKISRAGGWVRKLSAPYIHGKLIVVDGERAYLGSVNLTENSFDENREVGIIVSQPEIVQRFLSVFEKDWASAREYLSGS